MKLIDADLLIRELKKAEKYHHTLSCCEAGLEGAHAHGVKATLISELVDIVIKATR